MKTELKKIIVAGALVVAVAALGVMASVCGAVAEPLTIRFGYPGVGADNRPFATGDIVAVAHAGHYIDEEFAKDLDIKIEWTFFRDAGPALNLSLASGHLDFAAGLGDLPAIVGRSNGLQRRYLLTDKIRDTIYLAVRPDSGIERLEDLGRTPAVAFQGHQFLADRIIVLQPNPGQVARIINVGLARERGRSAPAFLRLRDEVPDVLGVRRATRDAAA